MPSLPELSPEAWIQRHAALVPAGGRVLDIACGSGRHGRLFLARGHSVTFADIDTSGVADLSGHAGAHLVAPEPKRAKIEGETAHSIFELTLDPQLRRNADSAGVRIGRADKSVISAGEVVLRDGDEVEVVGVKTRSIDPTVEMRLMRDTPERATLRSGKELPLIVSPVAA